MQASQILISFAIFFLAAAHWDDMRRNDRVTSARKTFLIMACIFGLVSAVLQLVL
jgi:uncharacterized membrane protein